MKLISCHIEGYGKIINKDISFKKELAQVIQPNGYGKSTISSFLKSMFYGLKTASAASKDFLDRIHYYPFTGNKFGGNLVFEMNQDIYKIERFFDKKTETKDSLKVFKNGNETTELGNNIGSKVFGLDSNAFERIIFINADMITLSTTSDINKKINNDMNDVDENFDIENVIKNIKNKIFKAKDIKELRDIIKKEEDKIANYKEIGVSLKDKYGRLNELKKQIAIKEEILKNSNSKNDIIKDWEMLDEKTIDYQT